jgi:hypothetical protein
MFVAQHSFALYPFKKGRGQNIRVAPLPQRWPDNPKRKLTEDEIKRKTRLSLIYKEVTLTEALTALDALPLCRGVSQLPDLSGITTAKVVTWMERDADGSGAMCSFLQLGTEQLGELR